jgi:hypothetical protein
MRLGSTVSVLTLSVVVPGAVKLRSAGDDIASVQFSTLPLAETQAALAWSVEPKSNADAMSNATAASVAKPEIPRNLCLNHFETTRDSTALDRTRVIITPPDPRRTGTNHPLPMQSIRLQQQRRLPRIEVM